MIDFFYYKMFFVKLRQIKDRYQKIWVMLFLNKCYLKIKAFKQKIFLLKNFCLNPWAYIITVFEIKIF